MVNAIIVSCVLLTSAPGSITRQDAEELLSTQPAGTYLVRLSDCIWGYALSYRADAKCRHYLIDASDGNYRFFGTNRAVHRSLHHLVDCHKVILYDSLSADCSFFRLRARAIFS